MKIVDILGATQHSGVGAKAARLADLHTRGYRVPAFVVIPASICTQLTILDAVKRKNLLDEVFNEITQALPCRQYAVRSAGFCEDTFVDSQAGRFTSRLAVETEALVSAITSVLEDAVAKLAPAEFAFSIIVQEYVPPQRSGVIFTSAPNGEAELVIEYADAVSASVVGGDQATTVRFMRTQAWEKQCPNEWSLLITAALDIEKLYNFAQDIEWVVSGGHFYIVQTRPVTTLSQKRWAGIVYLDLFKHPTPAYLFEKDSITETCPHPRPLAYSILQALYAADGPVFQAYREIGIRYTATNQLILFGNELFIDKEAELHSLFPTHSYLSTPSDKPQFTRWHGLKQSLVNSYRLARLDTTRLHPVTEDIKVMLSEAHTAEDTVLGVWKRFCASYKKIFIVNLAAQQALARLQQLVPQTRSTTITDILTETLVLRELVGDLVGRPVGNSISFDDTSPFVLGQGSESSLAATALLLDSVPPWKRALANQAVAEATYWLNWREVGRWATVRLITNLREAIAATQSPSWLQVLHVFATIDEVIDGVVVKGACEARLQKYEAASILQLPDRIASFPRTRLAITSSLGVSPGRGIGILVTAEQVQTTPGEKILLTETLTPELTKYFDSISGIVSARGGLLSHLAIVAREHKIPVVVSRDVARECLGKVVSIDGSTGSVRVN